ncbi:MAG TPA: hypothetical protein VKS79_21190 [Gemmataceae bacterium]|nr:hypothetical protein [Gemmataceae bacterium]
MSLWAAMSNLLNDKSHQADLKSFLPADLAAAIFGKPAAEPRPVDMGAMRALVLSGKMK